MLNSDTYFPLRRICVLGDCISLILLKSKCIYLYLVFIIHTRLYCKILYCIVLSYCSRFWCIVLYFSVFSAYVANKRLH